MAKSPTQCTLDKWRKLGYMTQVVEKWNPHARIRQDLFGIIDVLAVGHGETVAIQSTSDNNLSARVRKIEDSEALGELRKAEWTVLAEGWKKVKGRWKDRVVDIS